MIARNNPLTNQVRMMVGGQEPLVVAEKRRWDIRAGQQESQTAADRTSSWNCDYRLVGAVAATGESDPER